MIGVAPPSPFLTYTSSLWESFALAEPTLVVRDSSLRQPSFRMTEKPAFYICHSEQVTRGCARHDREETERALGYERGGAKRPRTETVYAMVLRARF